MINIAKKTMKIAQENIYIVLGVKLFLLIFALIGIMPMWLAVLIDMGVSIFAVSNSLRMLESENKFN